MWLHGLLSSSRYRSNSQFLAFFMAHMIILSYVTIAYSQDVGNRRPQLSQRSADALRAIIPGVQEELGLSEDQKKKIAEINTELRKETAKMDSQLQKQTEKADTPEKPVREQARLRNSSLVQIQEVHGESIAKILTVAQRKRANQISIQLAGVHAFERTDVQEALALTPETIEQIRSIIRDTLGPEFMAANMAILKQPATDRQQTESEKKARNQSQKTYDDTLVKTRCQFIFPCMKTRCQFIFPCPPTDLDLPVRVWDEHSDRPTRNWSTTPSTGAIIARLSFSTTRTTSRSSAAWAGLSSDTPSGSTAIA